MTDRMPIWNRPLVWLAAFVAAIAAGVAYAETAVEQQQLAAAQLSQLAIRGQFDQVLTRLKTEPVDFEPNRVQNLVDRIERYQANEAEAKRKRQEEYDKALARVIEFIDTGMIRFEADPEDPESKPRIGNLEDAMVAAIDAHSLTDNPQALLDEHSVKRVMARVEEEAARAVQQNDWVEALTLYRLLSLLNERDENYRDHVRRVSKHVRVLQFYAPDELEKLYMRRIERRARLNNDDEEPPTVFDGESWSARLHGIQSTMLRETLRRASRHHVEGGGPKPMVIGGIENLLILLDTDALRETFPTLADEKKVRKFREFLRQQLAELENPERKLTSVEALMLTDQVIRLNPLSVDLPEEVIVFELAQGATENLDDFTAVIWPEDLEQFSRSTQGKFFGVGIQISRRDGRLICVSPLANTPAQRAGIKAGDVIVEVDGRPTSAWSLDRAVREITGPEGTQVVLGIERAGEAETLKFSVSRAEIIIESIRGWQHTGVHGDWNYWIDEQDHIAYVRLSQFIPQTVDDLDRAIKQLKEDGAINGLILDLRFNPGGLLSSAVDVVDRFVTEGPIVFTVDAQGHRTHTSSAIKSRTHDPFPVVVLINQGSASASEIVSGALQDYGRATIVGTRSFGKGSVQDLFPLAGHRAYLKLTTQYYMLPLGRIIHRKPTADKWGIEPDIMVDMTNQQVADSLELRQEADVLREEDGVAVDEQIADDPGQMVHADQILDQGLDPQLEAALLVLKTRLLAQHLSIATIEKPVDTP